MALTDNIIE